MPTLVTCRTRCFMMVSQELVNSFSPYDKGDQNVIFNLGCSISMNFDSVSFIFILWNIEELLKFSLPYFPHQQNEDNDICLIRFL